MLAGPMRILFFVLLVLVCAAASAEITCEQFGVIAQETVRQRDQGASLSRLLAEVERGEMKDRLTLQELALVRDVIRYSFNSILSPAEVVEACRQGGMVVPSR
jgi:hypothetical protein